MKSAQEPLYCFSSNLWSCLFALKRTNFWFCLTPLESYWYDFSFFKDLSNLQLNNFMNENKEFHLKLLLNFTYTVDLAKQLYQKVCTVDAFSLSFSLGVCKFMFWSLPWHSINQFLMLYLQSNPTRKWVRLLLHKIGTLSDAWLSI